MKTVILAGGLGTRLAEETTIRPKPMVEIGGHPILWHVMSIYAARGFREFVIACGYKGEIIKQYFSDFFHHHSDWSVDLRTGSRVVKGVPLDEIAGNGIDDDGAHIREVRDQVDLGDGQPALVPVVATVFLGPYLGAVARRAAGCTAPTDVAAGCPGARLHPLGIPVAPGSLFAYTVSLSVLLTVVVLPVVGAVADRSAHKRLLLAAFAYIGAGATIGTQPRPRRWAAPPEPGRRAASRCRPRRNG